MIFPGRVYIDPMGRLLFVTFKGDPEIEELESQVFDNPINGKSMRVTRYRKDGRSMSTGSKASRSTGLSSPQVVERVELDFPASPVEK